MIIKWRSPTMRHVSRTHRVALDGLFDTINLDPKIQIQYVDTKHHFWQRATSHVMSGKFFECANSNCIEKSADTQGTMSTRLEECRKPAARAKSKRRSVEFSSVAERCRDGQEYEETRSGRKGPGTSEFAWKPEEYEETRSVWKLRHRR